MKYFSIFLLVLLTSCSTINEEMFLSYDESVSLSLDNMEKQTNNIQSLGISLYSLEASLGVQNILDAELVRSDPYNVEYRSNPFFTTITETLNSIHTFNSFYKSYSSILLSVASNDMGLSKSVATYNSSLKSITEDLEISNDIVNASIDTTSLISNAIFERVTYNTRIAHLQEISKNSTELIINILDIYLDIMNDLEFTMNDYYSRYYFHLENLMALGQDSFIKRDISNELIELTINHKENMNDLLKLKNSLESLKELEIELHQRIMNEDLGENEDLQDFVIRNYELYEELQ